MHLVALALVALLSQRFARGRVREGALLGVILADLIVVSFT
ncbi:MAG: hypothetical protein U0271_28565 [Polyangiaceae bacterium]